MIRKTILTIGLCVCSTGAALFAADFWETKPFTIWSDKELQAAMTDSPWSRRVNVVLNSIGRGGSLGESEGRGGGRGGGGGGGGADGGGGGGRGGGITAPPQLRLLLTWRSALPMKQALVRAQVGQSGSIPAESQAILARTEEVYVITIEGLPPQYARALDGMNAVTFLKRDRKAPIASTDSAAEKVGTGLVVVFAFPRTDAITLQDKDVEFVTKLGQVEIKKKFSLKDMVFHGQLEL